MNLNFLLLNDEAKILRIRFHFHAVLYILGDTLDITAGFDFETHGDLQQGVDYGVFYILCPLFLSITAI